MNRPKNIESNSQILKGIGASSWFYISKEGDKYRIKRYSEQGKLECSSLFTPDMNDFDITSDYKFTYVSHCKECRIIQKNRTYLFKTDEYEY